MARPEHGPPDEGKRPSRDRAASGPRTTDRAGVPAARRTGDGPRLRGRLRGPTATARPATATARPGTATGQRGVPTRDRDPSSERDGRATPDGRAARVRRPAGSGRWEDVPGVPRRRATGRAVPDAARRPDAPEASAPEARAPEDRAPTGSRPSASVVTGAGTRAVARSPRTRGSAGRCRAAGRRGTSGSAPSPATTRGRPARRPPGGTSDGTGRVATAADRRPPVPRGPAGRPPVRRAWAPTSPDAIASPGAHRRATRSSWPDGGRSRRPSPRAARRAACWWCPERRAALEQLVLHATTLRIPVVEVEGGSLTALTGFDGHQGVALVVEPRRWATIDEVMALRRGARRATVRAGARLARGSPERGHAAAQRRGLRGPRRGVPDASLGAHRARGHQGIGGRGRASPAWCRSTTSVAASWTCTRRGLRLVGADESAQLAYRDADLRGPLALVVGSEGRGIAGHVRRRLDLVGAHPDARAGRARSTPRSPARCCCSRRPPSVRHPCVRRPRPAAARRRGARARRAPGTPRPTDARRCADAPTPEPEPRRPRPRGDPGTAARCRRRRPSAADGPDDARCRGARRPGPPDCCPASTGLRAPRRGHGTRRCRSGYPSFGSRPRQGSHRCVPGREYGILTRRRRRSSIGRAAVL